MPPRPRRVRDPRGRVYQRQTRRTRVTQRYARVARVWRTRFLHSLGWNEAQFGPPHWPLLPYSVELTTARQRRTLRRHRRQSQRAAVMALHRNNMPPDVIANIRSFLEPADLS